MRRIAVFSDIHGNFQVLEAIIKDIESDGIDEIVPSSDKCVDIVIKHNIKLILGNHEEYFINGYEGNEYTPEGERDQRSWVHS